jgi:membrane protease subunit HflC
MKTLMVIAGRSRSRWRRHVASAVYTVGEVEQAIITQFGKPVGAPVTTAGLKLKLPFVQDVNRIDKPGSGVGRQPSDMPTKDKLYISVDLFARWKITDPLQYFLRLRDERSAQSRLDDILGSETRNAVAKHELIEIIRTTKGPRTAAGRAADRSQELAQDIGALVADPEGARACRAGDLRGGRGEGARLRHRAARHPLQADQLQ